MLKIKSTIWDWVLGKSDKQKPVIAPGHKGLGLGLSSQPMQLASGRILNRQKIYSQEIEEFVYEGRILFVHSSNVASAQYFPEDEKLQIEYLSGGVWLYGQVTISEAVHFAQAPSKGKWLWQHVRIQGTKTGHKKPATKIR